MRGSEGLTTDLYTQAKTFINHAEGDLTELRAYTKLLYNTEELTPTLILFACSTVFEFFAEKYFATNNQ